MVREAMNDDRSRMTNDIDDTSALASYFGEQKERAFNLSIILLKTKFRHSSTMNYFLVIYTISQKA